MMENSTNPNASKSLDALAMVRLGQQLRALRLEMGERSGEIAPKLMAARTQIEGIETGALEAFYSPSYYLNLFDRYARLLGVADAEVERMLDELQGRATPAPADQPVAEPSAGPAVGIPEAAEAAAQSEAQSAGATSEVPEATTPETAKVISLDASRAASSSESSAEFAPASAPKRSNTLAMLVLVLAAGLGAWWFFDQPNQMGGVLSTTEALPKPSVESIQAARQTAETPSPVVAPVTAGPQDSAAPASDRQAEKPADKPAEKPAAAKPIADQLNKPASEKPSIQSPSSNQATGESADDQQAAKPASAGGQPALSLTFKERGWYWVRNSDNSVSEIGVPAGQTVRFDEMPVYLVLSRPALIEVEAKGKKIELRRNEETRDIGRYTRSMLERGTSTPPEPAAEPAQQDASTQN